MEERGEPQPLPPGERFFALLERAKNGEKIKFSELKEASMAQKNDYETRGPNNGIFPEKPWPVDQEIEELVGLFNAQEFIFTDTSCAGHTDKVKMTFTGMKPSKITRQELDLIPEEMKRDLRIEHDIVEDTYTLYGKHWFQGEERETPLFVSTCTEGEVIHKAGYIGFYCDATNSKTPDLVENVKKLCDQLLPEARIDTKTEGGLLRAYITFYPSAIEYHLDEKVANEYKKRKDKFIAELSFLLGAMSSVS